MCIRDRIGDHSTKDFWDNATQALKLLASADERLETLEKYISDGSLGKING